MRLCIVVGALALAGCEHSNHIDPATLQSIRQSVTAEHPDAQVGVVFAVEPKGRPFAAISDLPADQFHDGDPITFIDRNQAQLTHGIVRRIVGDTVHVEWYPPPQNSRNPRVGDLAIRYHPTRAPFVPSEVITRPAQPRPTEMQPIDAPIAPPPPDAPAAVPIPATQP